MFLMECKMMRDKKKYKKCICFDNKAGYFVTIFQHLCEIFGAGLAVVENEHEDLYLKGLLGRLIGNVCQVNRNLQMLQVAHKWD